MLFLEVDNAIGQHEADIDIRISLEKLKQHRQDVEPPEHDRRGDDQVTPRRNVFACRGALSFVDVIEDSLAGSNVGTTRIGEDESPTGSSDEPGSQMRFQLRDLSADGCERHPQLARSP